MSYADEQITEPMAAEMNEELEQSLTTPSPEKQIGGSSLRWPQSHQPQGWKKELKDGVLHFAETAVDNEESVQEHADAFTEWAIPFISDLLLEEKAKAVSEAEGRFEIALRYAANFDEKTFDRIFAGYKALGVKLEDHGNSTNIFDQHLPGSSSSLHNI